MPTLTRTTGRAVTVHTYTADESGWRSNSHLLELPESLLLVDAPLLAADAERIRDDARRIGKPLRRVVVTHAHPDHFASAGRFDAPVQALAEVGAAVAAVGDRQIRGAYALTGLPLDDVPSAPSFDAALADGVQIVDGVGLTFRTVRDAEASVQLVLEIPDESLLVAGDLVYAGVHPFLAGRQLESWRTAIERLAEGPAQVVLPGHGVPGPSALAETDAYLAAVAPALATAKSGAELDELLDAAHPGLRGRSMHAMQNYVLFPAVS